MNHQKRAILINYLKQEFMELSERYDDVCKGVWDGNILARNVKSIYMTQEMIILAIGNNDIYEIKGEIDSDLIPHILNFSFLTNCKDKKWLKKVHLPVKEQMVLQEMINSNFNSNKEYSAFFYKGYYKEVISKWNNGVTHSGAYYLDEWPMYLVYNPCVGYSLLKDLEQYLIKQLSCSRISDYEKKLLQKSLIYIKKHPNYSMAKMILKNIKE